MWHESKITYEQMDESLNFKTITEVFLLFAVSYGDVEVQLAELLRGRVNEYDIPAIRRVKFGEIIFNNTKEPFYKVKMEFEEDEDKKRTVYALVPASSVSDAEAKVHEANKHSLRPYKILDAIKTKILGVYDPKNEIWAGDFRNRMDDLQEQRKAAKAPEKVKKPGLFDNLNEN